MILFFVLGAVLLLVAIGLVAIALDDAPPTTGVHRSLAALEAISCAPAEMTKEFDKPFGERVIEPLQERALQVGRRLSGSDSSERLRKKLDAAGNPRDWSADRVISGKVLGAVAMAPVGWALALLLGAGLLVILVSVSAGAALGFFIPDFYLYQRAHDRAERMQGDLADAIDLMTISVESGLGFDAAVQQVARNTQGPLAEEFSRVLREMQIGQSRSEALRGLGERSAVPDLKAFVSAMVQADSFGIPIAQVLRVQSQEMRVKRRQRAETKAQQVPVKITIPLIFFILPALFVAVMGPAALNVLDSLG